jgi:hypothetical protein
MLSPKLVLSLIASESRQSPHRRTASSDNVTARSTSAWDAPTSAASGNVCLVWDHPPTPGIPEYQMPTPRFVLGRKPLGAGQVSPGPLRYRPERRTVWWSLTAQGFQDAVLKAAVTTTAA